jgi:hypothetical protein
MKTDHLPESSNVEDRRGQTGGFGGMVGRRGGGKIGLGTIVVALAAWWLFDINPLTVIGAVDSLPSSGQLQNETVKSGSVQDEMGRFASKTLGTTEKVWQDVFAQSGAQYQAPKLVLFSGRTETHCGMGSAAVGPFYCPADSKVYIDLGFFDVLKREMGANGDFAQAYVIAHEVGHHVQNLQGITDKVDALRGRISEREYKQLSVRVELQADCYAGVWAKRAHEQANILEQGDIEEAMNAAARIGDDALQKQSQGYVVPDSFTHGSSEQRVRWFNKGLQSGNPSVCDTFSTKVL